jgi:hypothetical protein
MKKEASLPHPVFYLFFWETGIKTSETCIVKIIKHVIDIIIPLFPA